jgi:uncharacterized protein (TIGR02145 family)
LKFKIVVKKTKSSTIIRTSLADYRKEMRMINVPLYNNWILLVKLMNGKMKQIGIICITLALFATSCNQARSQTQTTTYQSPTDDVGVVINGIRWATRNVDLPGTFAETPECFGMFFQWNRRKGWNAVDERVTGWNGSFITDEEWEKENDPCPPGWRIPTENELRTLKDAGSVWVTQNGVNGHLFGDTPNQIFLPAVGRRIGRSGRLDSADTNNYYFGSHYWSSTPFPIDNRAAATLWFLEYNYEFEEGISFFGSSKSDGNSVRCVAINETPTENTTHICYPPPPPTLLIKDIDGDGISDTIRIHYFIHPRHKRFIAENVQVCDTVDEYEDGFYRVVVRLSSRGFEKMQSADMSFRILGAAVVEQGIFPTENGFEFYESVARGGFHEDRFRFQYDAETGRIRLVELVQSSTPGRFYDGTENLNLLTGEFVGDWYIRRFHQDYDEDILHRMPTVRTTMNVGKFFLEDLGVDDAIHKVVREMGSFRFDEQQTFINDYLGGN